MNKKAFAFLSVSILVGALAIPLLAQSMMRLQANVPFEFIVDGKALPAGEYSINLDLSPRLVRLRGFEARTGAIALTNWVQVQSKDPAAETKLVFHRYGDKYFLSEVSDGYDSIGMQLSVTHTERELSKTASTQAPEIVAVLARR